VIVQFVVGKDGSVENVAITKSPDDALDSEVTRVVSSSPKWEPGKQRGQTVRVKFTLPVDFALN
jgi:TonB family protein